MPRMIFAILFGSYFFLPEKFNPTSLNVMQVINDDVASVSEKKGLSGEQATATFPETQIKVITAQQLFDDWVSRDVVLSPKGHIELEYGETYEDDGAAAGHSYTPNKEELSDIVWARKELIVPDPTANKAILLIQHTGNPVITINDNKIGLHPVKGGGKAWKAYEFDPHLLRKGSNMITISGRSTIRIALQKDYQTNATDHPDRSYRSTDKGNTWDRKHLGAGGDLDGEYYVRLYLEHYRRAATMLSPVIDAGNLDDRIISPSLTGLKPLQLNINGKQENGRIILHTRTGSTLVPSAGTWSGWNELPANSIIQKPKGRYVQISVDLTTDDPLQTPKLYSITIGAEHPVAGDWKKKIKAIHHHNNKIIKSAIDFKYEPFDHPKLKQFRDQYHLDEVVKGAATEFEVITRLAAWSSKQFNKMHLSEFYPAWDALEILKPYKDGTPVGGFCQQYNILFLQACESMGLAGRAVSISPGGETESKIRGGHEVVEIWSNEFSKWIYVDGNMAWYATDKNNVPLSLLELRSRQLDLLKGKDSVFTKFVQIVPTTRTWQSFRDWPPFMEIRMIPRSNFLQQTAPLPLNQGMEDWPWTGHELWADNKSSTTLIYPKRIRRAGNWEWTINTTHFMLEATNIPGVINVHLETNTPGFQTFIGKIDNSAEKKVIENFTWTLHHGTNSLTVFSKNIAGRAGPSSNIVLEW